MGQFSCLVCLGGGAIINDTVKSIGAGIEILDVPAFASSLCERVVQARHSTFLKRNAIINYAILYVLVSAVMYSSLICEQTSTNCLADRPYNLRIFF
jgi:hypothetical protein